MRPSGSSSRERAIRVVVALALGTALGLLSEFAKYDQDEVALWLPDLVVGLVFIGTGAWAWSWQRGTSVLLGATGVAWFAANAFPVLTYAHRGFVIHLLLAYTGWRVRSRLALISVVVGYAVCLTAIWSYDVPSLLLAGALLFVLAHERSGTAGLVRHHKTLALQAGSALVVAIAAGATLRLVLPQYTITTPALWLYEAALGAIAISLTMALRRPVAPLTDLVVELGETRSGSLRDALARALADPSLALGYWQPDQEAYVEEVTGRQIALPDDEELGRGVRWIERDGSPFAVLVYDSLLASDPRLLDAVEAATRLTDANAALHSELRASVHEVEASRRRLLLAADEQRRALEERLHVGPEQGLLQLRDRIAMLGTGGPDERALRQTEQTIDELHVLARGLHPRELAYGLPTALTMLAGRSPTSVRLGAVDDCGVDEINAAIYYVCSEALTNAAKHSAAREVSIDVARHNGALVVEIVDDGCGGAEVSAGTGLRGLSDRIEALGGHLVVGSPPGEGTRLHAVLPAAGSRP